MTHKISVGVTDKRLGPGVQTIPLVGPGNPSSKMQKYLNPDQSGGAESKTKVPDIPSSVIERAIKNELTRRRNKTRRRDPRPAMLEEALN